MKYPVCLLKCYLLVKLSNANRHNYFGYVYSIFKIGENLGRLYPGQNLGNKHNNFLELRLRFPEFVTTKHRPHTRLPVPSAAHQTGPARADPARPGTAPIQPSRARSDPIPRTCRCRDCHQSVKKSGAAFEPGPCSAGLGPCCNPSDERRLAGKLSHLRRRACHARSSPHPSALFRPCLRPSERVPVVRSSRCNPFRPVKTASSGAGAVSTGQNGPGCARTVANRAGTALTGAVMTGHQTCGGDPRVTAVFYRAVQFKDTVNSWRTWRALARSEQPRVI